MGSFLWQVFTSPGEWRAGRGTFTTSVLASQRLYSLVLCVLFPVWAEGFYPLMVPPLGMEGTIATISARTPSEACFFFLAVQLMGWLFSGLAGAWHHLTSTASHLDRVPFSR